MRICSIYDDDYPWDVRVEKFGRALTEEGHQVFLAVRNRKRAGRYERVDTMDVWRMPLLDWLPADVDVSLMFPAFFSPRWLSHISSVARRNHCEAILVRDLPLALSAISVGRAMKVPVLLDMAENYPAALRAIHEHKRPTLADHLARNPAAAQLVEDLALPLLEHVFVVCEENRQRLMVKGVPPDQVSVVGNTPDLEVFSQDIGPSAEVVERYRDRFVILYVGAIDPFRGLDTLVDALPAIRERIPSVKLAVIGRGHGQGEVEERARRRGVSDLVDFVGFIPLRDLPLYVSRGDVCVIPHHRNDHIDTTLPNKLFDYMALGRAVLATDAVPLTRIIEAEGCGLVYRSGDAASLASRVVELADDERRREMGERGALAVRDRYNWGADKRVLQDVVGSLAG